MFGRSSLRRSLLERRVIEYVVLAYVARRKCRVARQVYDRWAAASSSEQAAIAYLAYRAALGSEEAAARIYGEVLEAVGRLLKTERHSRPLARGTACR